MSRIKHTKTKTKLQLNQSASPPLRSGTGIAMLNPSTNISKELIDLIVSLSEDKLSGTKKNTPGRKYNGTAEFLTNDNAEYLYLTNSYVARGIDTESEAIIRNGWTVKANNTSDQPYIDLILKSNNCISLIKDINAYIELYGQPMMEMYSDRKLKTTKFDILPPTETDYLRDTEQNIMFDQYGEPQGYTQKRQGQYIATWSGNDAKRVIVFKYRTLGGYYVGIPGIQTLLYPSIEYGNIRSSIADSFVRSLPVSHFKATDASEEQLGAISSSVGDKFTARTVYVTDERVDIKNIGVTNDIDLFKFIEPTLSEIAACFHMPIEMLGATQFLKGDDFLDRYAEWVEHIKMKQQIIASIFERKVFNVIFPDGVVVKFNSPVSSSTNDLINVVSFAVQSNAITPEQAFEILNRNQVFGTFESDSITKPKSGVDSNGVQTKKEEKEITNTEDDV